MRLTLERFLPLEYSLSNPFRFSFVPFCHAQYGSAKYISDFSVFSISLQQANSRPLSQVIVFTASFGSLDSADIIASAIVSPLVNWRFVRETRSEKVFRLYSRGYLVSKTYNDNISLFISHYHNLKFQL